MSEQTSAVTFRVSDFIGDDGVTYSDIEVIVEMDGRHSGHGQPRENVGAPADERSMMAAKKRASRHGSKLLMTTEQLARLVLRQVKRMSDAEKAKLREVLSREFKTAKLPRVN